MISVIVPIYNAAPYLPALLADLRAQKETTLDILLIDDGSTDASSSLCRQAAKQDGRFHHLRQEHSGVAAARDHGLRLAQGEFIAFLDADDRIDANYFSALLRACQEADIAVCDVLMEEGGAVRTRFSAGERMMSQESAIECLLSRREINSGPCGKLFRRAVLSGLQFPPLSAYEDILFVKDAFSRAKTVASTSKTAYHYLQNAAGTMARQNRAPSLDIITATDALLCDIVRKPTLSPMCLYATVSHLYQYVLALDDANLDAAAFRSGARRLLRKYERHILRCRAFPWKEKLLYTVFAYGLRR